MAAVEWTPVAQPPRIHKQYLALSVPVNSREREHLVVLWYFPKTEQWWHPDLGITIDQGELSYWRALPALPARS